MEPLDICAVLVTFNPDHRLMESLHCLVNQVGHIVVVDNNSSSSMASYLAAVCQDLNITLLLNHKNQGIAAALNTGVDFALQNGFQWVYTLDQDSVIFPDTISNILICYSKYPKKESLAIIGTNYLEQTIHSGPATAEFDESTFWVKQKLIITSGSLLSLDSYRRVGPFKEDLFLYYVDHEYCLRLGLAGYDLILACKAHMAHSTGRCEIRSFLGKKVVVLNYDPWKHFYIARNGFLLVRMYFLVEPRWCLLRVLVQLKRFMNTIFFERDKLPKFYFIVKGIFAAAENVVTNEIGPAA